MSQEKTHDLYDFMKQLSDEMAAEYDRIQKRATEDPGTAGDQGEENWAELLRGWLPSTYKIVTKGRIISQNSITSPQVDVLVLKDIYPEKLLNKKLYLAAGVAAAFECKTTLKANHIAEAMETCVKIKNLYPIREGSPYKELHTPITYGLLAHSHSWQGENSTPKENIHQKLMEAGKSHVTHPPLDLDFLCVADLTTWTSSKMTVLLPLVVKQMNYIYNLDIKYDKPPYTLSYSSYDERVPFPPNQAKNFTSIGALISNLTVRLAWEDSALRDLADYYGHVKMKGSGTGNIRLWTTSSIYSDKIRSCIEDGYWLKDTYNEWNLLFP